MLYKSSRALNHSPEGVAGSCESVLPHDPRWAAALVSDIHGARPGTGHREQLISFARIIFSSNYSGVIPPPKHGVIGRAGCRLRSLIGWRRELSTGGGFGSFRGHTRAPRHSPAAPPQPNAASAFSLQRHAHTEPTAASNLLIGAARRPPPVPRRANKA